MQLDTAFVNKSILKITPNLTLTKNDNTINYPLDLNFFANKKIILMQLVTQHVLLPIIVYLNHVHFI